MFQSLEDSGTRFLRGQLVLVAAGPGTGKSAFALTLAMKAKVPALYFSADSDAFIQLTRMVSIATGKRIEESTQDVIAGDLGDAAHTLERLPIRFNYSASPSLDQIEDSMKAYDEVYGDFPALVVIDNITNLRSGGEADDDPFSGLESLLDYLHDMARQTGACVVGLHHVTGPYNDSNKPIPLSGIKGQVGRVPEVVLTLYREASDYGSDTLHVSTVKQRGGKADASGESTTELEFVGDRMRIADFEERAPVSRGW
ncbi:DnaB-like helicase C-terminal domain-containing protein [Prescottella equi]